MHGEGGGGGVLPVRVVPQVVQQLCSCLFGGHPKGDLLGDQVLADRPVDKAPLHHSRVDIGRAQRRCHMVQRVPVSLAQPDPSRGELVRPGANSRYGVAGRSRPRPVTKRLQACFWIGVTVAAVTPSAGEHAPDHLGVQVGAAGGQRPVTADYAIERQNERHRSGLLQHRSMAELGCQANGPCRPPAEPAGYERLDIIGIPQRLQNTGAPGWVASADSELAIPRSWPAGQHDPPARGQRVRLADPVVDPASLIQRIGHQQRWRVPFLEQCPQGIDDP